MSEIRKRMGRWQGEAVVMAVMAALAMPMPVSSADHSSPKKHDPLYLGYTGKKWQRDYGVLSGNCNRQAVGAVLAEGVGGATGSRVGKGDRPQVATVIGAGTMVGAKVAREMDETDRACVGHALELAEIERDVAWTNADKGMAYRVMPLGGYSLEGRPCREFVTRVSGQGRSETVRHKACSGGHGVWQIVG